MATVWEVNKGDTGKPITATLTNDGAAVDLTGATVALRMTRKATGTVKVDSAAVTVTSAAAGRVSYPWQAADVDTVGAYDARFVVTLPSGKVISFPTNDDERYFTVKVLPPS